ncbi:MAG: hypothetical protein PHW46_03495 [Candidatus Omnitrophica bacterium]|nr:hypothetical protein [Candidatus Omnitrophota bacterium]
MRAECLLTGPEKASMNFYIIGSTPHLHLNQAYANILTMKNLVWACVIILLIAAAALGSFFIYRSPYAGIIIDCVAFVAGIFLLFEASYKIIISKRSIFPGQLNRVFRAVIGMCIMTIHLLQFMRY